METQVRRRGDEYELTVDGEHAGRLVLAERGDAVVLEHTYVDDAFSGRGLASVLVKAVLDDLLGHGTEVVAVCEYVQSWLDRHPDYDVLVERADRGDGQA